MHRFTIAVEVILLDASWSSPTTIYRPADYGFLFPPDGFAAGMQGAQGWVPYQGFLLRKEALAGSSSLLGKVVNLTHARASLATMGALVAGETWDLDVGEVTTRLGASPRLDFQSMVEKVRSHSAHQITFY